MRQVADCSEEYLCGCLLHGLVVADSEQDPDVGVRGVAGRRVSAESTRRMAHSTSHAGRYLPEFTATRQTCARSSRTLDVDEHRSGAAAHARPIRRALKRVEGSAQSSPSAARAGACAWLEALQSACAASHSGDHTTDRWRSSWSSFSDGRAGRFWWR